MGDFYQEGLNETPKDDLKALDCYIRAAELGSAAACTGIGISYREGDIGLAVNEERAALFERVGALRGEIAARHNIGCVEYDDLGNHEIGIRHWKIAAEAGYQPSLNVLREVYNDTDGEEPGKEFISKEEMDKVYRVGHEAQEEIKSEEREKHRAFIEELVKMQC
jgi:TPR repeat protein